MVFDGVILAGGEGRRLGGRDKAVLEIGGRRLLDRVVDALRAAGVVVAVGPARHCARPVTWTHEMPPGGGPAAALEAGLELVAAPLVVVLAVDLPFVDHAVVAGLVGAVGAHDGAVLVDAGGRDQMLAGAYRTDALRSRLGALEAVRGASMRDVLSDMMLQRVPDAAAALDCDTWLDIGAARRCEGG